MSNIIDYMKWRGDLTFAQDSFNEIDNLILSQLVYVELNNIVPVTKNRRSLCSTQPNCFSSRITNRNYSIMSP